MPTSAGPDGVAEGAGWQAPARGRRPYRRRPVLGHGELREIRPTERGRVGSASIGDRMDGASRLTVQPKRRSYSAISSKRSGAIHLIVASWSGDAKMHSMQETRPKPS